MQEHPLPTSPRLALNLIKLILLFSLATGNASVRQNFPTHRRIKIELFPGANVEDQSFLP
jgi:hypothetical protein